MRNISHLGKESKIPVPDEIKGWNWGGFLLSWVWGIGNNVYIALLVIVPPFNLIMPFVLGYKGNEWVWRKNNFEDVKKFKDLQKKWSYAGFAVIGFLLIMFILAALKN